MSRRHAAYIFWLLWLANFMNYADRYAFLAIGDHVQTEFGLSDTQCDLLATSFLFVYTLSILPLGLLADRIKRKIVVAAVSPRGDAQWNSSRRSRASWPPLATSLITTIGSPLAPSR